MQQHFLKKKKLSRRVAPQYTNKHQPADSLEKTPKACVLSTHLIFNPPLLETDYKIGTVSSQDGENPFRRGRFDSPVFSERIQQVVRFEDGREVVDLNDVSKLFRIEAEVQALVQSVVVLGVLDGDAPWLVHMGLNLTATPKINVRTREIKERKFLLSFLAGELPKISIKRQCYLQQTRAQ